MKKSNRRLLAERDTIDWFPSVDAAKCDGCGVCVNFCAKKVFVLEQGTANVVHPYECVVLCAGCVPKCHNQAISFPKRADFEHFVAYDD